MLPESAMNVLREFRQRMTAAPRDVVWAIEHSEAEQVFEAQRSFDGQKHARWAAEHLVEMFRRNNLDPWRELTDAKAWAIKILRRRYLVQSEFLDDAYGRAMELAEGR